MNEKFNKGERNIDETLTNDYNFKLVRKLCIVNMEVMQLLTDCETRILDIFKSIADKMPKVHRVLKLRDSKHLIQGTEKVKDHFYPPSPKLSYENNIVGFIHKFTKPNWFHGVNVIMSNGDQSDVPPYDGKHDGWQSVRIRPEGAQVRKVVMYGR